MQIAVHSRHLLHSGGGWHTNKKGPKLNSEGPTLVTSISSLRMRTKWNEKKKKRGKEFFSCTIQFCGGEYILGSFVSFDLYTKVEEKFIFYFWFTINSLLNDRRVHLLHKFYLSMISYYFSKIRLAFLKKRRSLCIVPCCIFGVSVWPKTKSSYTIHNG